MLRLVGVLGYAQKTLLVRLCVISTKIVVCLTEKSIGSLYNWCVYRCVHGLCGSQLLGFIPRVVYKISLQCMPCMVSAAMV